MRHEGLIRNRYPEVLFLSRPFSRNALAAHMDDVLGFIAEGINYEYEDAANSVHWESAEGGYTLATLDSWICSNTSDSK